MVTRRFARRDVDDLQIVGRDVGNVTGALTGAAWGTWQPTGLTVEACRFAPAAAVSGSGTVMFERPRPSEVMRLSSFAAAALLRAKHSCFDAAPVHALDCDERCCSKHRSRSGELKRE